ncbi:restriction endonuclease subunit S, partial [Lacticaseibacillus paracasei]
GNIGTTNVVKSTRPIAYYVSLALIRPNDAIDVYYLNYAINGLSFQRELRRRTLSVAFPQKINKQEIGKSIVDLPSPSEQIQIGNLFVLLDNLIAATQRRISALEEIKEALSQYLFVQKWRFRGYSNPWKRVVLGEIADIIGGGTPKTDEPKFWNGKIDWYAPAEIGSNRYVSGSVRTITSVGLNKSSASILPANRTILFTSRAGIGNAAILKKDAATNQGFQSLVLKDGVDVYFMYSKIPEIKQKAIRIAAGSTFLEISGKKLSQIALLVPELNEQQRIGAFFKKLDDLIAANHSKVSRLNLLKRFLLQGLFI